MSTSRRVWRWIKALSVPALRELLFIGFWIFFLFVIPLAVNELAPNAPFWAYVIVSLLSVRVMFDVVKPRRELWLEYVRQELDVRWRWVDTARGEDAEMRVGCARLIYQLLSLAVWIFGLFNLDSLAQFFKLIGLPPVVGVLLALALTLLLWIETMRYFLARVKAITLLCFVDGELLWISRWMSGWERERIVEQIRREDEE